MVNIVSVALVPEELGKGEHRAVAIVAQVAHSRLCGGIEIEDLLIDRRNGSQPLKHAHAGRDQVSEVLSRATQVCHRELL